MEINEFLDFVDNSLLEIQNAFSEMREHLAAEVDETQLDELQDVLLEEFKAQVAAMTPAKWCVPKLKYEHLPSWALERIDGSKPGSPRY